MYPVELFTAYFTFHAASSILLRIVLLDGRPMEHFNLINFCSVLWYYGIVPIICLASAVFVFVCLPTIVEIFIKTFLNCYYLFGIAGYYVVFMACTLVSCSEIVTFVQIAAINDKRSGY